jgi:hypothetical protein
MPDSTHSKLYSRWIGPATIAKVKSPYSYIVDMPDGSRKHFHANKLRPFVARVHSLGVIQEEDEAFGEIISTPYLQDSGLKPSQKIDSETVAHLNSEQRRELMDVLDRYPECWSDTPGYCNLFCHEINLQPDFKPKQARAYRIPEILRPEVERQLEQLVKDGFLVPSKSPNSSPIVCILKPNKKEVRIACDFRYVNRYTVNDAYPMPNVEEVINKVGHARYISIFDCKGAYWQVPVRESDRWLTAIVTPLGLFEWTRCPFGMKFSGSSFCRAVNQILNPVREFCTSFVDDMAVFSHEWSSHLNHLDQFLRIIRDAGLTLHCAKVVLARPEVKYVGQYVGSGKRRPNPEKLEVIRTLERPTTRKQLRSVLGMFGYFRSYIAGFSSIAKPLTDLTSKRVPDVLMWSEVEQKAFDTLKERLCKISELAIPIIGSPFNLYADASGTSVGSCLTQINKEGKELPIAYTSQKLNDTQRKWSTIEREAYAVISSLKRWHEIIFGAHITVYSDHNPLTYLVESAPKSSKLTRWALALQSYDIDLKYKKGEQNTVADFLSRL